jgi:hypothetical protein
MILNAIIAELFPQCPIIHRRYARTCVSTWLKHPPIFPNCFGRDAQLLIITTLHIFLEQLPDHSNSLEYHVDYRSDFEHLFYSQ